MKDQGVEDWRSDLSAHEEQKVDMALSALNVGELSDRQKRLFALTLTKSEKRFQENDRKIQLREDFKIFENQLMDESSSIVWRSSSIVEDMGKVANFNKSWHDEAEPEPQQPPSRRSNSPIFTEDDLSELEDEDEDLLHNTMAQMGGKWSRAVMGNAREDVISEWAVIKLQAAYRGRKARAHVEQVIRESRNYDHAVLERRFSSSGIQSVGNHEAATKIQSLWRGILATTKVYHIWLDAEKDAQNKAATNVQSLYRMRRAKKRVAEVKMVSAMDLSWDTLDQDQYDEELSYDQMTKGLNSSPLDLPESERKYSNLAKLNAALSTKRSNGKDIGLKSARLDLGLAYWEQPLLAPEVMTAMEWDEDLVQTDDDFEGQDEELTFPDSQPGKLMDKTPVLEHQQDSIVMSENFVALGIHGPRTIGRVDNEVGSDDSDSSSDDDGHENNDSYSSASDAEYDNGPLFQRFDNSLRGVRKLIPKPAPGIVLLREKDKNNAPLAPSTKEEKGNSQKLTPSQSIDATNIAKSNIVDIEYLPKFLRKNPTRQQGDATTDNGNNVDLDQNGKRKYSVRVSFLNIVKKQQKEIRQQKAKLKAKREEAAIRVQSQWRKRQGRFTAFLLRRAIAEENITFEEHTKRMHERAKWQNTFVHIVGYASKETERDTPTHNSVISQETPNSIATAYGLDIATFVEYNKAICQPEVSTNEPLLVGTAVILPMGAKRIPGSEISDVRLKSRSLSNNRKHNLAGVFDRMTDTGVASQTSLRREAGRLSTEHLMKMNGVMHRSPTSPLSPDVQKVGREPLLTEAQAAQLAAEKLAFEKMSRLRDTSPDAFYRISNNKAFNDVASTHSRPWFVPRSAPVNRKSRKKNQNQRDIRALLRTGMTSQSLAKDRIRDRHAERHLANRNEEEIAMLLQLQKEAEAKERHLKDQYNVGPAHALLHGDKRSGDAYTISEILKKQLIKGDKAEIQRLSRFDYRGGTERFFENVLFVVKLTGMLPNKIGFPSSIPCLRPRSKAKIVIEAFNVGRANLSRRAHSKRGDASAIIPVQRGSLVDFNLKAPKGSKLRIGSAPSFSNDASRGNSKIIPRAKEVRLLWKGMDSSLEIPLVCGKDAISGLVRVRLHLICGPRVGSIDFKIRILEDAPGGKSMILRRNFV